MVRLYTPAHKRYSDQGLIIPNVEFSEGTRPWIGTEVAPYLPLQLHEEYHNEFYTVLTGKVVALDTSGFITMAGLRKQIQQIQDLGVYRLGGGNNSKLDFSTVSEAAGGVADLHTAGIKLSRYDATDVLQGVRSSDGYVVVAGQPVIWSFMKDVRNAKANLANQAWDEADADVTDVVTDTYHFELAGSINVSAPVGIAPYSYYRSSRKQANGVVLSPVGHVSAYSVWDPTQLKFHNYHKQGRVAIVCDYVCEYPVISDSSKVLMKGVSAFNATTANIRPGDFVTFDVESNLTLAPRKGGAVTKQDLFDGPDLEGLTFSAGDTNKAERTAATLIARYFDERLGQIIRYIPRHVDTAYLDRVKSRFESGAGSDFGDIDRLPGSANSGQPWSNWVTGRTGNNEDGTVLVNLTTR